MEFRKELEEFTEVIARDDRREAMKTADIGIPVDQARKADFNFDRAMREAEEFFRSHSFHVFN